MINMWKAEISCTILNVFRPYNGIGVLKLPFLEELYEKTFVVPYVYIRIPVYIMLVYVIFIPYTVSFSDTTCLHLEFKAQENHSNSQIRSNFM